LITRVISASDQAIDPASMRMQSCRAREPRSPRFQVTSKNLTSDENMPAAADFERSLAELEAIVHKLEQGELSLDDSLKHFERGVQLTRACQAALKQAEQKVEILMRKSGAPDQFEAAPFDANAEDDRDG
jgi:exodeoxyribonuclease VII small subunit